MPQKKSARPARKKTAKKPKKKKRAVRTILKNQWDAGPLNVFGYTPYPFTAESPDWARYITAT